MAERGKDGHFGPPGMRERAARIGATFSVTSVQGDGTAILAKCLGGTEAQAAHRLAVDGKASEALPLTPNQTRSVTLTIAEVPGTGKYAGAVRITAPGSKPVDQGSLR